MAPRRGVHRGAGLMFMALALTVGRGAQPFPTPGNAAQPAFVVQALRQELARYQSLASRDELTAMAPMATLVRPGDVTPGLGALQRLLAAIGDLPPDAPVATDSVYREPLVTGVRTFQARHGLEPDGVLGERTQAALRVPLTWRVRQIEMALERLRGLPGPDGARTLLVNIPTFEVWAWDAGASGSEAVLRMRAITGKPSTPTPVLSAWLSVVVFRPYWNVPLSILRDEILPALASEPSYLAARDLEVVDGPGDGARVVEPTPEHLARLRAGLLRVRQRPGPDNALGLVKFHFDNEAQVYLHGTPRQSLFLRARRDFSHGCVRVEDPIALAEWVLRGTGLWDRQRIVAATLGERTQQITVTHPVRVMLTYLTAMPGADGVVRFGDDLYGLDRVLASRPPA